MKRRRLELPRSNFHYPLKVARLPIPPPLQVFCYISSSAQNRTRTCTYKHTHLKRARLPIPPPGHFENRSLSTYTNISKRAENETRTRDPNLGKVVLYQLSYFRKTDISPNALNCRGDRIRTCDHLVPNQARYRAALHPAAIFIDYSISDLRVQRYCILFIPPNFTTLFFILSLWIKTAFSTILVVLRKLYKYKNFIFYSCFGFILVFSLFLYGIVVLKAQKIFCYGEPSRQGRVKL